MRNYDTDLGFHRMVTPLVTVVTLVIFNFSVELIKQIGIQATKGCLYITFELRIG